MNVYSVHMYTMIYLKLYKTGRTVHEINLWIFVIFTFFFPQSEPPPLTPLLLTVGSFLYTYILLCIIYVWYI